ncbi:MULTISPECIES: hypothetical protein [Luteibacter]|uniref:hypothetical protein n=1 Tax=Luteibacter TaxID=242605 RepID=UPI00055E4073|nr:MULTISPECIES: hypothetical protein [unclassified Luteibacter]
MSGANLETFVLLDKHNRVLRRLEVSAALQTEISKVFLDQENSFLGDPTRHNVIPFDPGYNSGRDELQEISNFDDEFDLHKAIKAPLSVPYFDEKIDSLESIRAVLTGYRTGTQSRVLVQNFDRRRVISPEGFSILRRGKTFERMKDTGLTLDKRLSCLVVDDTLVFRRFHNARLIFDLTEYFDEATDLQTANFFGFSSPAIPAAASMMEISDSWVRKKVALISRKGPIDVKQISKLGAAAAAFKVPLTVSGKGKNLKIDFPANKADLKQVLRFIDEDFYESLVTPGNRYYSNSKKKV